MTGRNLVTPGTSVPPTSSSDHNQPIDLAQKSQNSRISDAVTSVVKGGTTFVQFGSTQPIALNAPSHVVTCSRNETGITGTAGVTLFSRQPSQGALNLVTPNTGSSLGSFSNISVPARSVSHATSTSVTSTSSHPTSGYHIPRGAAAVANMTASRSQNLSSLIRTTSQTIGAPNTATLTSPRASIISQRMVPISNNSWITRSTSTTAVLTTKSASPQVSGRATITPGRTSHSPAVPVTTYHGGPVKSGAIVTGPIRSQAPSTLRIGATSEGQRPQTHTQKGIHISHPVSHTQKYIGAGTVTGNGRGVGTTSFINPGNVSSGIGSSTIYTPTSTLVTSLASSGTTITPHPGNRNQPPNTVRLTSGVTSVFSQGSMQGNVTSLGGGICLTPPSGAVITHHPTTFTRAQTVDQVPLKTSLVRTSHPTSQSHAIKGNMTGLPAGTQISFSGQKVLAQPAHVPSLALTQLSNVTGQKTAGGAASTQAGHGPVPFQTRPGTTVTSPMVRGSGPTISMTKVIPQGKSPVGHGVATTGSLATAGATSSHPNQSLVTTPVQSLQQQQSQTAHSSPGIGAPVASDSQPPPQTSVFLHRAPHSAVTMSTGITVSQPERTLATVTQYSISTPYYLDSTNHATFPVTASIMPASHYIPSTMSAGTLRVGNNGVSSTVSSSNADSNTHQNVSAAMPIMKPNASPRPSILRKRSDIESGLPLKAAKNLSAALNIPMTSPPSPIRPDSRGNGNVSSGSTTVSANSSPGTQTKEEETAVTSLKIPQSTSKSESSEDGAGVTATAQCLVSFPVSARVPAATTSATMSKTSGSDGLTTSISIIDKVALCSLNTAASSPVATSLIGDGVSPRKKPRKQQLMGNELHEARSSEEDFEHPVLKKIKREIPCNKMVIAPPESDEDRESSSEPPLPPLCQNARKPPNNNNNNNNNNSWRDATPSPEPVLKRPHMSLINSYRQTWKSRHNHFSRHSDVRPKEEKKRTVNEIASQKLAMQRVNGWKVMHLSGQVQDLEEMESDVINRLQIVLNGIEKRQQLRKAYKDFDKDVDRLSELVKANIQRSIIIKDQMADAKTQMSKIFNHKENIVNILTKYSNKRTLRKKEKL